MKFLILIGLKQCVRCYLGFKGCSTNPRHSSLLSISFERVSSICDAFYDVIEACLTNNKAGNAGFRVSNYCKYFLVKLLCLLKHDIRMTNYLLHALLCCLPIVVCLCTPHLSYQFEIFTSQNINSNLSLICG